MRRFTMVSNAFSKELANHGATVAVYFMCDNFARGALDAPRDASDGSGVGGSRLEHRGKRRPLGHVLKWRREREK